MTVVMRRSSLAKELSSHLKQILTAVSEGFFFMGASCGVLSGEDNIIININVKYAHTHKNRMMSRNEFFLSKTWD